MEGEITQPLAQPLAETASKIALEKGTERRQATGENISKLFSGIREKIDKGITFAFGAPEAVSYLAKEAVAASKKGLNEAGEEIGTAVVGGVTGAIEKTKTFVTEGVKGAGEKVGILVVESVTGVVDKINGAKDRLVSRVLGAKNRLVGRYEQTRDATTSKITDLGKRAAVWGLSNITQPIESRLQQVYELPAVVREWQATKAETAAFFQEEKAKDIRELGEARVRKMQELIVRMQEENEKQAADIELVQDAARARAESLTDLAEERRRLAQNNFSKSRGLVVSLQTS